MVKHAELLRDPITGGIVRGVRDQDVSRGGSQCVTPRVLITFSGLEYFDIKQISTK